MVGRNAEQTPPARVEEEVGVARLVRGGLVVLGHHAPAGQLSLFLVLIPVFALVVPFLIPLGQQGRHERNGMVPGPMEA